METETFETTEATTALAPEEFTELSDLIEELGLTEQKRFINTETSTRMPYRIMTAEEQSVYGTLCPTKVKFEEYAQDLIPLRILEVAREALKFKDDNDRSFFNKGLLVWHPKSAEEKDPILVGVWEDPAKSYIQKTYILARWGEILEPFKKLRSMAAGRLRSERTTGLLEAISMLKNDLAFYKNADEDSVIKKAPDALYFSPYPRR
jgi:hypothetical protein